MKITALIMAGGRGERFWPKSRRSMPKQFLSLSDDIKSMIQLTVERVLPIIDIKDIFIATNKEYKALILKQLPNIPEENILCEPIARNTAPCIGLGAIHINKKYEDAIMLVLPSDHLIKFNNMFLTTLHDACDVAEKNRNLVTLGIAPDYAETGYGYVKFNPHAMEGRAYKVDRFVEKPTLEVAKEYLATEEYLWNSGMFVWKLSSILYNIEKFMPQIYSSLITIRDAIGTEVEEEVLERAFFEMPPQSIDYGIMEKAENIYILPGNFGWDDVGSWLSVGRIKKTNEFGNVIGGNIITVDTHNCVIQGEKKLIATVGIDNLIIVDTEDATLICAKDSASDIKKIIENLKICNRDDYI